MTRTMTDSDGNAVTANSVNNSGTGTGVYYDFSWGIAGATTGSAGDEFTSTLSGFETGSSGVTSFLAAGGGGGVTVNLTTPNLALAAPVIAPQFAGAVTLTTPNLALAAPVLAPAGSGAATVQLTTPNLQLGAPLITPFIGVPGASGVAPVPDSDRPGLLRKPFLW
jgi:hypothetical protein